LEVPWIGLVNDSSSAESMATGNLLAVNLPALGARRSLRTANFYAFLFRFTGNLVLRRLVLIQPLTVAMCGAGAKYFCGDAVPPVTGDGDLASCRKAEDMQVSAEREHHVERMESTAWLLLDVADYLRQPLGASPVDMRMRATLRSKIMTQLNREERAGDPLRVTSRIRNIVAPPRKGK